MEKTNVVTVETRFTDTPLLRTIFGSFYVSGKLPTYPSPKPTLTLSSYLGQNVGLGEG